MLIDKVGVYLHLCVWCVVVCVCACACVYVHVCMDVCVCVCAYTWMCESEKDHETAIQNVVIDEQPCMDKSFMRQLSKIVIDVDLPQVLYYLPYTFVCSISTVALLVHSECCDCCEWFPKCASFSGLWLSLWRCVLL